MDVGEKREWWQLCWVHDTKEHRVQTARIHQILIRRWGCNTANLGATGVSKHMCLTKHPIKECFEGFRVNGKTGTAFLNPDS